MTEVAREAGAPQEAPASVGEPKRVGIWMLAVGSVGVVYGDIGTSPLYAFREAVNAAVGSGPVTREAVLGVLSLILWALIRRRDHQICAAAAARRQ